jgi:hypothetical protein
MHAVIKVAAGAVLVSALALQGSPPKDQLPQFTDDGKLTRPTGYEQWIQVGASTGLSYNTPQQLPAAGAAPGMFHNVYLQPWAYRYVMEHGDFPENAMFVMTFYEASRKSNPARSGFYEGDRVAGFEVHLKRKEIDSTGWGFFGFGSDSSRPQAKEPSALACYSCHAKEAAFDNAFVQFYPALRARLVGKADNQLRSAP